VSGSILLGKIDGVYSFDAMVHVDLHTLFVYWMSAAKVLRPGGVLAMSVADACNEKGFMKLLHNAPGVYRLQGNTGGHFMWISREIVESTLNRFTDAIWKSTLEKKILFYPSFWSFSTCSGKRPAHSSP
jgi:hypothetical protein